MPRKSLKKTASAHIALCYVCLSWTKDKSDANSPEQQRANIQLVCDAQGWTPE